MRRPPSEIGIKLPLMLSMFIFSQGAACGKVEDVVANLQVMEDYHSIERDNIRKPMVGLEEKFREALKNRQKEATAAGDLQGVIAAKTVIEDLDRGFASIPSEDPAVAKLQLPYLSQRKALEAGVQKATAKLDQEYLAALKKLVVDLTKSSDIDGALKAREAADQFSTVLAAADTSKPAASTPKQDPWQMKAKEEFPELANPDSELSKRVRARVKELRATSPSYFSNPQWPYDLAKEIQTSIVGTAPVKQSIPSNAVKYQDKYFYCYDQKCSWQQARARCEKLGGHLVVIHDAATQAFLVPILTDKILWLGASDEKVEGKWQWVDGTPLDYSFWRPGEPNASKPDEDFLAGLDRNWIDLPGDDPGPVGFVCEWDGK